MPNLYLSSDKGLAGAYNANVVRYTIKEIERLKEQEINITLRDFNRLLKEYELKQLNKTCKV